MLLFFLFKSASGASKLLQKLLKKVKILTPALCPHSNRSSDGYASHSDSLC